MGYLPQDVELFAGSVAANIARLQQPDSQAVVRAAQLARAHELILRLPDGYETEIGEGGSLLSGGQRQRIALARALYGDPRLLILDEPNANLDEEGDEALCAALADLKLRGVTVVLVGHRRRVMNQLDKLAVLRNGAIEAIGPAATILARLRDGAKVAALPHRRIRCRCRHEPADYLLASLLDTPPLETTAARSLSRRAVLVPLAVATTLLICWASLAPISGAVIASARIKVELERKTVQHREGGIVREIRVRNGQKVHAGDVLVVVDDVRSDAELSLLEDQLLAERVRHARGSGRNHSRRGLRFRRATFHRAARA